MFHVRSHDHGMFYWILIGLSTCSLSGHMTLECSMDIWLDPGMFHVRSHDHGMFYQHLIGFLRCSMLGHMTMEHSTDVWLVPRKCSMTFHVNFTDVSWDSSLFSVDSWYLLFSHGFQGQVTWLPASLFLFSSHHLSVLTLSRSILMYSLIRIFPCATPPKIPCGLTVATSR